MQTFSRILILTLFFSNTLFAQEVFSLERAISYALENSSEIRNGQLDIADADAQIEENKAIGYPQINAGLNYTNYLEIPASVAVANTFDPTAPDDLLVKIQFGTNHSIQGFGELSWQAIDPSWFVALKAARKFREYTGENFNSITQKVRNDVIQAYMPALILAVNLETLDKNIKNLTELLDGTKLTYEAGFAEQLDVDRLELSLANLGVERENLTRQTETSLNYLKFVMGYPIDQPITVSDNINSLLQDATEEDLTGEVNFSRRPEYLAAQKGIELNKINITRIKNMYYPTLRLFSTYQHTWQGNELSNTLNFPAFFVGGGVNVPIFDGFMKKYQIQRAKIDLEQAEIQTRDLERVISMEVRNARIDYRNAKNRVVTQDKTLKLAEKIYNTTLIKFQEGVGTSLELSTAENELYEAQRNHIQAQYDVLVAKANLDKALGN